MSDHLEDAAEAANETPGSAKAAPGGFNLASAPVKDKTENAAAEWLHLRHPLEDHLLYIGAGAKSDGSLDDVTQASPVRVKVLFARHKTLVTEKRRLEKQATLGARNRAATPEQEEKIALAVLRKAIVEFDNVWHGDTELDASNESHKEMFFNMADEYVDQVGTFSTERTHFFDTGSSD